MPVNNPPAFARADGEMCRSQEGMTLRDYFAGQALIGLLYRNDGVTIIEERIEEVYRFADAMLKARENQP